jgi:hypothetical protein
MIKKILYDNVFNFLDLFIKNPPDDKKPTRGSKKTKHIFFNSLKLERVYSS